MEFLLSKLFGTWPEIICQYQILVQLPDDETSCSTNKQSYANKQYKLIHMNKYDTKSKLNFLLI